MGMHGHGHADGAQHHRHKTDKAQDSSSIVQPLAQSRIALAEVHHLRVGQCFLQLFAHCHRVNRGCSFSGNHPLNAFGQLDQQPLAGTAARRQQPRTLQRSLRDHHPGSHSHACAHAVGLLLQDSRNREVPASQPQRLAHPGIQADKKLIGYNCRVPLQSLFKAHRWLQLRRSIVGVFAGVYSFERNQQRHWVRRHRGHRDGLRYPGRANSRLLAPIKDRRDLVVFRRCWLMKDPRTQIPGHQRARFSAQSSAKAVAESANSHKGRNAHSHRQHHKAEFARRGLQVTPADGPGALPAQGSLSHSAPAPQVAP